MDRITQPLTARHLENVHINKGKSKLGVRVTQQVSVRRAKKHASQTGKKHIGQRRNPAVFMLHRAQEGKVRI